MDLANVILIDDDQFVRTALSAGLSAYGINTLQAFSSAGPAIDFAKKEKVEVAIVDLDLGPGPSGIDICHILRKDNPQIGLVMLTSFSDPRIWQQDAQPLPTGCRFVTKNNLSDFSQLVTEVLAARNKPTAKLKQGSTSKNQLTSSQLEVLKLIALGMSNQEIADQRQVSLKAIDGLIAKIHKELDLPRSKSLNPRVQLTRAYMKISGKSAPGE